MRGDPGTRAALGRIGAVGGLEDRPLQPALGLVRSGRTCRGTARVFACVFARVCGRRCGFARERVPRCWRSLAGKRFSWSVGGRKGGKSRFHCSQVPETPGKSQEVLLRFFK